MARCTYTVDAKGVAEMVIDNPPMNALSTPVLNDIEEAVIRALNDDNVRVILFTGAGKAFIAGADIKEIGKLTNSSSGEEYLKNGQDIFNLIENADKPFIAAINGYALGGGMELALACHIRLADKNALLGLPEIKLGIIPGYGGTQRAARTMGKARAMEMILSGNFFSAQQAADYGLINRVAAEGKVLEDARELASVMASRGRPAIKAAMKAISEGLAGDFSRGLKLEREEFGKLCGTENMKEGVAAFLEKRDPEPRDN
jgi:enoyl-CoA hydratase/carnithine racemase